MIKAPATIDEVQSIYVRLAWFVFWATLVTAFLIRWVRWLWGYAWGRHDFITEETQYGYEEDDSDDEDEDEDGEDTTDPGSEPGLGSVEDDESRRSSRHSHDEGEHRRREGEDHLHVPKKEEG